MGNILNLLGGADIGHIMEQVDYYVRIAVIAFLSICALLVVLFAVYVGWRMAKAEDDGARKQAKSQLIYSIIGIVAISIIATVLGAVIPALQQSSPTQTGNEAIDDTLEVVQYVVSMVLNLLATAAVAFAVYVGWQLMKAEDDGKRKQAKMQLIYTVIGIVGVILINTIATAVIGALIGNM